MLSDNKMTDFEELDDEMFNPDFVKESEEKKKWKTFRMSAQKFLVTWSKQAARDDVKQFLEQVLAFFGKKYGDISEYIISWEQHNSEKKKFDKNFPYHIHAYFGFKKKRNVTTSSYFNLPPQLTISGSNQQANIKNQQ